MEDNDKLEKEGSRFPRYRSHEEVRAIKISEVITESFGGFMCIGRIIPEGDLPPILVASDFLEKHSPKAGGYYVVHDDGRASFAPAEAFEEGYIRI